MGGGVLYDQEKGWWKQEPLMYPCCGLSGNSASVAFLLIKVPLQGIPCVKACASQKLDY